MEVRILGKVLHLTYSSSLSRLCEINSSFDMGVLRVAYTDKNRNGSFISKDTYERCLQTIFNCPIVCNYDRETDSIGSHDIEIVRDVDGGMKIVNVTTPIGVVPESAEPFWETIEEEDGELHEYLCTQVLLWKRQEAYQKIKKDGISAESMEITVKDGSIDKQSGLFIIRDFEFTAFCILGEDVEPCFESASLEVFSCGELKQQMELMLAELKESYSAITPRSGVDDITTIKNSMEGGEVLDEKMALVAEFGLDASALDFSLEDFTLDELREKFTAMQSNDNDTEADAEVSDPDAPENFELAGQFLDNLVTSLEAEKVETCFGEMPRYWYVDHDTDAAEVYCYDSNDWKLYGFTYSMNGDNVVIDFESKKRMKYAIVAFDEGEQASPFASVFARAVESYTANDKQWSEKYQEASEKLTAAEANEVELKELRSFKKTADEEKRKADVSAVFATFGDLVGIDEFDKLVESNEQFTIEQLTEKCYAIRGKNKTQENFALAAKAPKLPVPTTEVENDEPYGGLFLRYGRK